MDCFVPRNDALLLICANPRKSVIANEVKQSITALSLVP